MPFSYQYNNYGPPIFIKETSLVSTPGAKINKFLGEINPWETWRPKWTDRDQ